MLKRIDVAIDDGILRVRKDEYSLTRMEGIEARSLTIRDHLVRFVLFGALFALLGWWIQPWIGTLLFVAGWPLALLTAGKYELRARFRNLQQDEEPLQLCLARSRDVQDFELFREIAMTVSGQLNGRSFLSLRG